MKCVVQHVTWYQFLNARSCKPICTKKCCYNYLAAGAYAHTLLAQNAVYIFFSYSFLLVIPFLECHTIGPHQRPITECLHIHNFKIETSQGVEFTAISCCRGGLGWSRCEGMTSRCKGLRATVSCANEGRKFGSLENNTTKRAISAWICISRGVILGTNFKEFSFQLTSANIPKLSLQLRDQLPWGFQGGGSGNQLHLQLALGSSHSRAILSLRAPKE